jgi:hypothetical protein
MASEPPKKIRWADLDDDDAEWPELPEVVSKHGIKVKKRAPYVPPHLRADKTKTREDTK